MAEMTREMAGSFEKKRKIQKNRSFLRAFTIWYFYSFNVLIFYTFIPHFPLTPLTRLELVDMLSVVALIFPIIIVSNFEIELHRTIVHRTGRNVKYTLSLTRRNEGIIIVGFSSYWKKYQYTIFLSVNSYLRFSSGEKLTHKKCSMPLKKHVENSCLRYDCPSIKIIKIYRYPFIIWGCDRCDLFISSSHGET